MRTIISALLVTFTLAGFAQDLPVVDEVYEKTLDNWQRSHARWKLRNFVPLIGLDLLKNGKNTFGKDPSNDIVVDSEKAPDFMGVIIKKKDKLTYVNTNDIAAELNGETVEEIEYTFDGDRNSERIKHKFIKWFIQYVEDDYFLRMIDETSPLVSAYEPYDFFPANQEFIVEGKYKEYKKIKVIPLNNVIGLTQRYNHTGSITFKFQGKKYQVEVLEGAMVMFSDYTNGITTFPHGRYLRVKPDEDGKVILDFNYSFSPPRSISLFTTCEIPPEQNQLPFSIYAGEMYENTGQEIIRNIKDDN